MHHRIEIRPAILEWAVQRAGWSRHDAERRVPWFADAVSGTGGPTWRQLQQFAAQVHVPVGALFLSEPPVDELPIPDFRRVGTVRVRQPSANLLDAIALCQQRQAWFLDEALYNGFDTCPLVGGYQQGQSPEQAASAMRSLLGLDVQLAPKAGDTGSRMRDLVSRAESHGVLVMISGVVGSNSNRKLDPSEFRGFALCDDRAPVIFVNAADAKVAQYFTLAHELAHLWRGESGVSAVEPHGATDSAVETWCNRFAAEFLVPTAELTTLIAADPTLRLDAVALARRFGVSALVMLIRLRDLALIDKDEFDAHYGSLCQSVPARSASAGGDFYATLASRTSRRFARAIVTGTLEGRVPYTDAFRLLGFQKLRVFDEVARRLGVLA